MITSVKKWLIYLSVFVAAFFLTVGTHLILKIFDSKPPYIEFDNESPVMSKKRFILKVRAKDEISGLHRSRVVLMQDSESMELVNVQLFGEREHKINIEVEENFLNVFRDGEIIVLVTATDNSRKKNTKTVEYKLILDSTPPKIRFISKPDTSLLGSPYICFFSVSDANLSEIFLRDGFQKFTILSANEYDENLPLGNFFSILTGTEFITAVDKAGNLTEERCTTNFTQPEKVGKNLEISKILLDRIVEAEGIIAAISELSQTKRIFGDVPPRLGLKSSKTLANFGDGIDNINFRGLWIDPLSSTQLECPTDGVIEKVIPGRGHITVSLNIGAGLRLIFTNLDKSYLTQGNKCSQGIILGSVKGPFGVYVKLRDKFIDPDTFFNSRIFTQNFIKVAAQAKKRLGNLPLTPLESAVLK